jgi:hypothetical protein
MRRPILVSATLLIGLLGATAAFAQAAALLSNVRKIYIEKMPDNLDQYLASSISRKFHGAVTVVLERGEADAVMKGVNIGAQTTTQATVQLVDKAERQVLWSGTAGDRSWATLQMKHGGQEKVADHLMGDLKKAMQR